MDKKYELYLTTKEWREKKVKRLQIDGFKCCNCGSPHNLQVHHLTYDNIYNEDVYNDLITLCNDCHREIEKSPHTGKEYKKPLNYGSNWKVKNKIPILANGLIFQEYLPGYCTNSLQLNGGEIRLCEVHFGYPDEEDEKFYNELKDELKEIGELDTLPPFSEFQWENKDRWDILVKTKHFGEGLSFTTNPNNIYAEIVEYMNGIVVLEIKRTSPWESYRSFTKKEVEDTIPKLDKLQEAYKKLKDY